jgi:membrane-bound serine protease (ClpP class)
MRLGLAFGGDGSCHRAATLLHLFPVVTSLRSFRSWFVFALLGAAMLLLAPLGAMSPQTQGGEPSASPRVLVATLRGKLGTTELARCHRTLRQADADGCAFVVFRIEDAGSQGEPQGDLQSLLDHVQRTTVPTVAVLSGRVVHGAAALALCCDRIYCLPRTDWGEVEKPEQDLGELLSAAPDEATAARLDGARAAMASRLQARDPKFRADAEKLALAMADPRMQLVAATVRQGGVERQQVLERGEIAPLQAAGGRLLGERALTRPLVVTAQEAEDFGLSGGTLQSFDQLADVLAFDRGALGEVTGSWVEDMVGWLELLQPFLLVAGFLLLVVEVKTPGIGIAGLFGVAFLVLAMCHGYLVGLAEIEEILVFFLGVAAIAVEIFLLPGTVVFGAVGFLCLVVALILSRQSFVLPHNAVEEQILLANVGNLTLLFLAVIVLGAVMWRLLPRVPWFNRVFLPAPASSAGGSGRGVADQGLTAYVGRIGTAATVLRPTGAMDLDGERLDVVTEGAFVEAGTPVRVLYVQGQRVVVAAEPPADRAGERGSVGLVVLLCVVGLLLLVAEVVFVSFGVIATMAAIALLSAVFVAFQQSVAFGALMVVVEAIAAPVVLTLSFKLLPKTKLGKAMILAGPASGGGDDPQLRALVGRQGETVSPLRPAGFARIDGARIDVVTRGEMLDAGCPIVVLDVAGNRVVVARKA